MKTTIYPFRKAGLWVFNDPTIGLVEEPFVSSATAMIDDALKKAGVWRGAHHGFKLSFSDGEESGWERADFVREESSGAWYGWQDKEGWLCPALMRYFPAPPKAIWFKAEQMTDPDTIREHYQSEETQCDTGDRK